MGCSSCGMNGHFGAYVPSTARSTITTPGPVVGVPNATGGMHQRISRAGMGDIFGANQTNWIEGVPNEYIAAGGLLIIMLAMMK